MKIAQDTFEIQSQKIFIKTCCQDFLNFSHVVYLSCIVLAISKIVHIVKSSSRLPSLKGVIALKAFSFWDEVWEGWVG